MTRVAAIVQARTGSRRFPEKVLAPLAGEPALARMMQRVARVSRAEWIIVATSSHPGDDAIETLCRERAIACARGPLDDVLARFVEAMPAACDAIVRLTGDCPLIDPGLVDDHIELYEQHRGAVDYVSNAVVRTHPDGLDVEVIAAALLRDAARHAIAAFDREHVTPWIQRRARQLPVAQDVDLSALRWTLDTPADYESIAALYERLPAGFDRDDVYRLLVDEPALIHADHPLDDDGRAHWRDRIRAHLAGEVLR